MKGFRLSRGHAVAACAVLVTVGGGALLWMRSSHSTPVASSMPARERSEGAVIFDRWCSDCHSTGGPGTQALERKYKGEIPAVLVERDDLSPDFIKPVVRNGMSFMPSFRKTEISDAELEILAAYISSRQARADAAAKTAYESKSR